MKNILFFAAFVAVLMPFSACDECESDVSITSVAPSENLGGYEVLIRTSGFSDAAKVAFGNVEATEKRTTASPGEIIARVPAGLAGDAEISVSEGECVERAPFRVLAAFPNGAQPWLPDLVVPTPPTNLPDLNVNNNWRNASADQAAAYGVFLAGEFVNGRATLNFDSNDPSNPDNSKEFDYRDPTSPLRNNPITGFVDKTNNEVKLTIDRTANGLGKEAFSGQFIAPPSGLDPTSVAILLTSETTGLQLLIVNY